MYDKYEKNEQYRPGIFDPPFLLPTEPKVSFPFICKQFGPHAFFSRLKRGKFLFFLDLFLKHTL